MNVTSTLNYKMSYNTVQDMEKHLNEGLFSAGDVITVGPDCYVYTGHTFEPISHVDELGSSSSSEEVEIVEQKCTSCGAPLPRIVSRYQEPVVCEYCGSIYELRWN